MWEPGSEKIFYKLKPVVDSYRGGFEVISTEDLIATLLELNRSLEGWEGEEQMVKSGHMVKLGQVKLS